MLTIFTPLIEWIPGADHSNTFRPQDKQAMSCLAAGRTAKAIRLYKRTLADCEQTLGADHPYTFRSRNNLAMGYRAAGRTAEAIPLLERTLADCERVLRAVHPDTLTSRDNLAMSYRAAGRTAEAILLLERTLADCERMLGADHPKTKAARKDLASLTGEPHSLDCVGLMGPRSFLQPSAVGFPPRWASSPGSDASVCNVYGRPKPRQVACPVGSRADSRP